MKHAVFRPPFIEEGPALPTQVVIPNKLQKLEFNATTPEGACRVTVVTGEMQAGVQASSTGNWVNQSATIKALVDPTLTPGQFRKSTATASVSQVNANSNAFPTNTQWLLDDVQATYDDEAGQVQLTVDVTCSASGNGTSVSTGRILFQVTTLAKV